MDFATLLASQRPDVIRAGVPLQAWWNKNGARELRARLAALGRQDVLNAYPTDNAGLMRWYTAWGSREYPNIWSAGPVAQQGNIAEQYGKVGADQAPTQPQWENVLPWENLKGQFSPYFQQAAQSYTEPEVTRQYRSNLSDYMNNLASSGGGRFGRGIGGTGSLAASAQRSLKEQMQDYVNQYNQALQGWYSGTGGAYEKARSAGDVYNFKVPTYAEFTGGQTTPPVTEVPTQPQSDKMLFSQYFG